MWKVLTSIALLGLSTNLEPGTLVVFVSLLRTERPKANAAAFVGGWLVSLALVFAVSYSLLHGRAPISGSTEERLVQLGEIAIGLLLAWFALHQWRRRNRSAEDRPPRAHRWLDHIGPRTAFFAAMWEQPWTVTMAAAVVVVRAHLSAADALAAFVVFAVASTASVGIVWVVFRRDPERAQHLMHAFETRIRTKGPRVFAAVAAVASIAFLADGSYGLLTS
ncbi:MAG: GAP family protein [Actinomycetota bacterium]